MKRVARNIVLAADIGDVLGQGCYDPEEVTWRGYRSFLTASLGVFVWLLGQNQTDD